ncbi:MAG: DUF5668 domain-containing protein [bacterium]
MSNKRLVWGVFLVLLGCLFLLTNFNVLVLNWFVLWRFWPLFLIALGAFSLFETGKRVPIAVGLSAVALAGVLVVIPRYLPWITRDVQKASVIETLTEPYTSGVEKASLSVDAGAGEYYLKDSTDAFVSVDTETNNGRFMLSRDRNGDDPHFLFIKRNPGPTWMLENTKNQAHVSLNQNPLWDLTFDLGATMADIDLSSFKINRLVMDAGASSIAIKLGALANATLVDLDTGASSITLSVPEASGCEILGDMDLSALQFKGFAKTDQQRYVTENFSTASQKITVNLDTGASKVVVERY